MDRLFGSKSKAPKPTLTGAITSLDDRTSAIAVKIAGLNAELASYQDKLSRMRPGPGQRAVRAKALRVLQRRRAYEAQQETLEAHTWNLEQVQTMQDTARNAAVTVEALRSSGRELRRTLGRVDVAAVERLQDEMADLVDVGNEIQESLARAYDVPEDVDEADLDAELEALGAEMELGRDAEVAGAVPAFMLDEVPEFVDEPPSALADGKVKQAAG